MSVDLAALELDAQKAAQVVQILAKMDLPAVAAKIEGLGKEKITVAEFYQIVMLVLQETDGGLSIAGLFFPWAAMADEWVRVAEIAIPIVWPLAVAGVQKFSAWMAAHPQHPYSVTIQPSPVPFEAFGHSFTGAAFA